MRCKNCGIIKKQPSTKMRLTQLCAVCEKTKILTSVENTVDNFLTELYEINLQFSVNCKICNLVMKKGEKGYRNNSSNYFCFKCGSLKMDKISKIVNEIKNNVLEKNTIRKNIENEKEKIKQIKNENQHKEKFRINKIFKNIFKKEVNEKLNSEIEFQYEESQIKKIDKTIEGKIVLLNEIQFRIKNFIQEDEVIQNPRKSKVEESTIKNSIQYQILKILDKESLQFLISDISENKYTKREIISSLSEDKELLKYFYPKMLDQLYKESLIHLCAEIGIITNENRENIIQEIIQKTLQKDFDHSKIISKYFQKDDLNYFIENTFRISGNKEEIINRIISSKFLLNFAQDSIVFLTKSELESIINQFELDQKRSKNEMRLLLKEKWESDRIIEQMNHNEMDKTIRLDNKDEKLIVNKKNIPVEKSKENTLQQEVLENRTGSVCKGICVKNKVDKVRGIGRYESGQVHCKICDVWLDYRGCHKKNGQPAEEDSRGMRCNCCNFQVRSKPRGKNSKEKLLNSEKKSADQLNQIISEALDIIRKNSAGIYKDILAEKLMLSETEFENLLPKLLRIDDIIEEYDGFSNIFLKSTKDKDEQKILKINNSKQIIHSNEDLNIKSISYKMVEEHNHWKTNINKKLKKDVINSYLKHRSLSKVYDEFSHLTKEKIRLHLISDSRIPQKLKEMENTMELHSDPRCSIAIALFATDYFNWDGESEKEKEVIELAKNISKYLQSDIKLNQLFKGKK